MKRSFHVFLMMLLAISVLFIGSLTYGAAAKAAAARQPQYGGTLTLYRAINPIAWDIRRMDLEALPRYWILCRTPHDG